MQTPQVEGIVSAAQLQQSADYLASLQLANGMIEWFPGGHTDPWNHIEAAMALATCGLFEEAKLGYDWLAGLQRADGSWHNYYLADSVENEKLDTNCIAYIATGIWHQFLATGDEAYAQKCWPMVEAAIEFVLAMQKPRGEIIWAREVDESPWDFALLTGSSSIAHSLGSAIRLADQVGQPRPHWSQARERLVDTIVNVPEAFEPKERWAMDWYYPVLAGALSGEAAAERLAERHDVFVMDGLGVRCVADQPWITTAETSECVIALLAAGLDDQATQLFSWVQSMRCQDGSYYTGVVHPQQDTFPTGERSAYSVAALILAADALDGSNPTSHLFTKHD